MGLYLRQLQIGPMQNFVYLIGDEERPDETVVIDAAWDVPAILRVAEEDGRKLTHALVTHRHFDHSNGIAPLLELTPVKVFAHRDDADALAGDLPKSAVTRVTGGETIEVGGVRLRCVHTPGHTPGSMCFLLDTSEGALVSGDTLFVNACGRCDLSGGDPEQMYDSLHHVLGALDSRTTLYPGHDYGDVQVSSLGRERERNPYLLVSSLRDFVQYRMHPRA